jgi:hypothetical protein
MGVHYRWELPNIVRAQLRLAHDLREDLVTLQLAYADDVRAIWSSYPEVAAAECELHRAEETAAAASEQVSAERVRLRSKRVGAELTTQLAEARADVKATRQARRDAIARVKDNAAQRLRERTATLLAAQKQLYRRYCQDNDLYWATYNDVFRNHKTAVQRIRRQRLEGKPATLRHHRFDGTGTITVQLQRTAAMPPRSPRLLSDPAGRYHNFLVLPWIDPDRWAAMTRAEQRAAGRVVVRMRAGTVNGQPQWIDIPVQAHRWLPADAEILNAVDRRSGCGTICTVVDHCPYRLAHSGGRRCCRCASGVAGYRTWNPALRRRSTQPLDISGRLSNVMVTDDGVTGSIVVPRSISGRLERHAVTAAARADSFNAVCDKLAAWLDEHGPQPYRDGNITGEQVRRWRSPARLAAVAIAWRDDHSRGVIAAVLEEWRSTDRKAWDGQEHGRRRALGHRDDLYRQIGALLAAQSAHVVVDDINIAAIAGSRLFPDDVPASLQQRIDRRRFHAAPASCVTRSAAAAAAVSAGRCRGGQGPVTGACRELRSREPRR